MTLPVLTDMQQLLRRLAIEEDDQRRDLARREDRLRRFEDLERPAYESWLRLEIGPIVCQPETSGQTSRRVFWPFRRCPTVSES